MTAPRDPQRTGHVCGPPVLRARVAVLAALLAGLSLSGCGGDDKPPATSASDRERTVDSIVAAIRAVPHVAGVGRTSSAYNPGGPLEPSRLTLTVRVEQGQPVSAISPEVTRIVWTSTLRPLDNLRLSFGDDSTTTPQQVTVVFTDKATADDLTRRYGPRPTGSGS